MKTNDYVKTILAREGKEKKQERVARLENKDLLKALQTSLKLASKAAEIADMVKRSVFYGTELNAEKLQAKYSELVTTVVYQKEGNLEDAAARFKEPGANRLLHASLGMITEAAEFAESLSSHVFDGEEFDRVNAKEELGDSTWYIGLAIDEIGTTFDEVFDTNNAKLEKRFGKVFSEDKAVNRDLEKEREVLEG